MNESEVHLRKAAILIDALDSRSADALLEQMGEEQAARVRSAVMNLGDIDAAEQEQIIHEFLGTDDGPVTKGPAEPFGVETGVELDPSLSDRFQAEPEKKATAATENDLSTPIWKAAGQLPTVESANNSDDSATTEPFAFLKNASGESVSRQLQDEHPQTVALVLAHLPPEKAADVLQRLSPVLQSDVLHRIALINEMDPAVVRDVEEHLHVVFTDHAASDQEGAGHDVLRAILGAADATTRDAMVSRLAQRDSQLAAAVASNDPSVAEGDSVVVSDNVKRQEKPHAFENSPPPPVDSTPVDPAAVDPAAVDSLEAESAAGEPEPVQREPRPTAPSLSFDDVSRLDNKDFATVLKAAHPQVTLLALTGARREVVARLMRELPRSDAKAFRRKMAQIGPLRLSDIEHAQHRLAEIADDLADRGLIRIPNPNKRFAAAA